MSKQLSTAEEFEALDRQSRDICELANEVSRALKRIDYAEPGAWEHHAHLSNMLDILFEISKRHRNMVFRSYLRALLRIIATAWRRISRAGSKTKPTR